MQLSKEVVSLKTKVRSDAQLKDLAVRRNKIISMLENRVEVATKRFNLVIADNAKLRGEIETLLKERTQFTQMWNKLISQLNTGKQVINDLIEQATITFNQRDEELNKIQALRERYSLCCVFCDVDPKITIYTTDSGIVIYVQNNIYGSRRR